MKATANTMPDLGTPIPTGEEVSDEIVQLADGIFDHMQPQFSRYIADPRRRAGEDGEVIRLNKNGSSLWEQGKYGHFAMRIADKASELEICEELFGEVTVGNFEVQDAMRLPDKSHGYFLNNCVDLSDPEEPKRYQPLGNLLLLHVLRDRHPRGTANGHRVVGVDYDAYPPEDWGERHSIGFELTTALTDPASEQPAIWKFGWSVKTRFDKADEPLQAVTSNFRGLVHTDDIRFGSPFTPDMRGHKRAHGGDVELLRNMFAIAKNLRPQVTPIKEQQKHDAKMNALWSQFRGGSSEQPKV